MSIFEQFSDDLGDQLPLSPDHVRTLHREIAVAVGRWFGSSTVSGVEATSSPAGIPAGMLLNYAGGGHHFFDTSQLAIETRSLSGDSRRAHVRVFVSELPADEAEARVRTRLSSLSVAVAPAGRFDVLGSLGRGKVPLVRAHPQLDAVLAVALPEGDLAPMTRSSLRDSLGDLPESELWTHAIANLRGDTKAALRRGETALHEEICGWWRPFEDGDLGLAALLMCPDLIRGALHGKVRAPWAVWLMTAGPSFFSAAPGAELDQKLRSGLSTVASDSELFILPWPLIHDADGVLGAGVPAAAGIMDEIWGPGMRLATAEGLTFQTAF